MSTTELLALVLGSGTRAFPVLSLAQELLVRFGSLQNLAEATITELCAIRGVGKAKAVQLKAALALAERVGVQVFETPQKMEHPQHVYSYLADFVEKKEEHFIAIFLDVRSHVIADEVIAIGSLTQAAVHPRELFYQAIRHKAAALIVAHNHPSGDPTPSPSDYLLTEELLAASHLLCIPIYDHVIVARRGYCSLRQHTASLGWERGKNR